MRKAKSNSSTMALLTRSLSADVAAVVRGKEIDLSRVSLFCRRQAECAALFGSIIQIEPGVFVLKSPFKENFIASLHVYYWPNAVYSPAEMVAMALIRHANWYLKTRDTDALRARPGAKQLSTWLFGHVSYGPGTYLEGIVRPTGEFTRDPEADGTSAILGWQDVSGNPPGLMIDIRGSGVAVQGPARRKLLQSIVDCLTVEMGLKRPSAGRPHLAGKAEEAAYLRDHRRAGRAEIAKHLCSCGRSHTQKCFDRLNKLADSFYRTQRSAFEKLVRDQMRKYPEINS
ncbi:MAG: hypothetical protein ACLPPV_14320 [Candidatus Korobacteraceae bacterium]|jgi:hypothetical protein